MKNLFIVHTPFNLMTAFILSRSAFAGDDNYLAVMHPQSFSDWQDEPVLNTCIRRLAVTGRSSFCCGGSAADRAVIVGR
ncbi:MAG: hypothetical protein PHQ31_07280 [Acidaminococcaceae bacterium]|nr:hypothetical protein [Acidaminococcaceae bacterium]